MYIVSFVIGLIIVISSIFLIRHEFNKAIRSQKTLLEQSRVYKGSDLFELLESMQLSIDEMNRAFYDIAGDLEGKYSIHEKELQLLTEKLEQLAAVTNQFNLTRQNAISDRESKMNVTEEKPLSAHIEKMKAQKLLEREAYEEDFNLMKFENSETTVQSASMSEDTEKMEKIVHLRSQGYTLPQIAKELGIGMGEIQLLINLKK